MDAAARILHHWQAIIEAIIELEPDVETYKIFGSHDSTRRTTNWLRIDGNRWNREEVWPGHVGEWEVGVFESWFDKDGMRVRMGKSRD